MNVGKGLGKPNKICSGKPFGSPCKFIAGVDPPTGYCDNDICIFIPKEAENSSNLQLIRIICALVWIIIFFVSKNVTHTF